MRPRFYAGIDSRPARRWPTARNSFNEAPLLRGDRPGYFDMEYLQRHASMRPRFYAGIDVCPFEECRELFWASMRPRFYAGIDCCLDMWPTSLSTLQ